MSLIKQSIVIILREKNEIESCLDIVKKESTQVLTLIIRWNMKNAFRHISILHRTWTFVSRQCSIGLEKKNVNNASSMKVVVKKRGNPEHSGESSFAKQMQLNSLGLWSLGRCKPVARPYFQKMIHLIHLNKLEKLGRIWHTFQWEHSFFFILENQKRKSVKKERLMPVF